MTDFPLVPSTSHAPVSLPARPKSGDTKTRADREALRAPRRARINVLPTQERMQELVEKAILALKEGIFWDRGSIVNIIL